MLVASCLIYQAVKAGEAEMTVRNRAKRSKYARVCPDLVPCIVSAGSLLDIDARKEAEHWSDTVPGSSFLLPVLSVDLLRARLPLNATRERT